jgi:hypothetical protein
LSGVKVDVKDEVDLQITADVGDTVLVELVLVSPSWRCFKVRVIRKHEGD